MQWVVISMMWGFIATIVATVLPVRIFSNDYALPILLWLAAPGHRPCLSCIASSCPHSACQDSFFNLSHRAVVQALEVTRYVWLLQPWEARGQLWMTMKNLCTGHVPESDDLSRHAGDFFGGKADHPSKHGNPVRKREREEGVLHTCVQFYLVHHARFHSHSSNKSDCVTLRELTLGDSCCAVPGGGGDCAAEADRGRDSRHAQQGLNSRGAPAAVPAAPIATAGDQGTNKQVGIPWRR